MRYLTITSIFLLLVTSLHSQRRATYVHPDFKEIANTHKKIAILPIATTISLRPNQMQEITDQELKEMEEQSSYTIQNSIESYFLNKKARKGFDVKIQNIKETNRLLRKNGITLENINSFAIAAIADILNVDAVIFGNMGSSKPNSNEVAFAVAIVTDIPLRTNMSTLELSLMDKSSEVLWKYQKTVGRGFGSLTESTTTPLIRKSARKLPYGQAR